MKWMLCLVLAGSGCTYISPPDPITLPVRSDGVYTVTCRSNAVQLSAVADGQAVKMVHVVDDWWEGNVAAKDGSTVFFQAGTRRSRPQKVNIVPGAIQ